MKLRHLDLFAGIGGFSLGLERTGGFETAAFCEFGRSFIHIFQRTADGATKRFSYAVKGLTGRITTEY